MTESIYHGLSLALLIAQVVGATLILLGSISLVRGMRGSGQSTEGIIALRASLITLILPLLLGVAGLIALFILTLWERSPLTTLIQGIAPLSTLVWVLWSHYSARDVQSGEMFEALVPLAPRSERLPEVLRERALLHRVKERSLNPRELARTALAAVDDYREHNPETPALSLDELLTLMRDALSDTRVACLQFPLGQTFTLADWLYEGERLTALWRRGLKQIERGRAFVNPLTLIDHKGLWGWSRANPATLFERELSAWLHYGLYLLIINRLGVLYDGSARDHKEKGESAAVTSSLDQPHASSQSQAEYKHQRQHQRQSKKHTHSRPQLWRVLTRKLSVPLWLYWALGTVAVTVNHGAIGLALGLTTGLLLGVSIGYVTSMRRWRREFSELGTLRRPSRADDAERNAKIDELWNGARERLEGRSEAESLSALLEFTQQMSVGVAMTYRRVEHAEAPLAFLNATVVDALQTAESICDDVLSWRKSGGALPILIGMLARFGIGAQRVEELIIESARAWAQETRAAENVEQPEELTLTQRAQSADIWIHTQLQDLNFLLRAPAELALSQINKQIRDLVTQELTLRALPLYQGAINDSLKHER